MHVVLTDPRPMTEGKGAWAIFSLGATGAFLLRTIAWTGLVSSHLNGFTGRIIVTSTHGILVRTEHQLFLTGWYPRAARVMMVTTR